jgi:hypothetical protein
VPEMSRRVRRLQRGITPPRRAIRISTGLGSLAAIGTRATRVSG